MLGFFILNSPFLYSPCVKNYASPFRNYSIQPKKPAAHPENSKKIKGNCSFVRKVSYLRFMKEKNLPEPTKSELEILQVLWKHGPSTVRFVNDQLNELKREVQYSSTLKLMQIMADKGLVLRDESQMKHVYSAAEEESKTKSFLLERFVNTLYDGSASSLLMQLLGNKTTSKKEIEAIKELIKKLDK